jgi:hypothetical protein
LHEIIKILKADKSYQPSNFKFENPDYHPDTPMYNTWWKAELKKCVEGFWYEGRFMPPQLYTYINQGVIERLDEANITSQRVTQPLLRDIEWLFFYNWLICRKFSGFEGDTKYSCNRYLLDPKFKREKASKYLIGAKGKLKEYIDPRDYLYMKHNNNYGIPLYENNASNLILLTGRGCGKLLEPDTKIRVKDGWKTMRDIEVMDKVYSSDGTLCNVIAKTPLQVNVNMYQITLQNGKKFKACEDHQWKVYDLKNGNMVRVKTTKQLFENNLIPRKSRKKEWSKMLYDSRFAIPLAKPVSQDTVVKTKLSPYLMGLLSTLEMKITYHFTLPNITRHVLLADIEKHLPKGYIIRPTKELFEYIIVHKTDKKKRFYSDYPEIYKLARYKQLSDEYKINGNHQVMREVLRGIFDRVNTATYDKYILKVKNKYLKNIIVELLDVLGLNYKITGRTYYDGRDKTKNYRYYKIVPYLDEKFNLKKEINDVKITHVVKSRLKYSTIKEIKPVGKGVGYCISVDSSDNTYVIDDYVVTHNSYWGMAAAIHEFIFNSVISYEQLIREIKSPNKTKVNCILTCELEDKAIDLINKIKTWYENMPGSYGDDDEYMPSPLYRAYTGTWSQKITQQVEKYYYTKDGNKAKRFDGSGSTLSVVTFNKDPYKTAGKRNSVTIVEEIGLCTNLITFWNANKDVQQVGRTKFGSTLGIGTGGDMEKVGSSRRLFENPEIYQCLSFDDTFENTGKKIGMFIPAYLGNNDFKDERGITDIDEGLQWYEENRRKLILNHGNSRDIDDEMMNRPIFPSEMFLSKQGNVFPIYELKQCLLNLISNPQRLEAGSKGTLVRCTDCKNGVAFENDIFGTSHYIDSFPIPKEYKKDKKYLQGCVRIWEHPVEDAPRGLYKLGYDTVHYDNVENPESLISVFVYKSNTRFLSSDNSAVYYDMIVAEYTGRHDLLDKNNEIVELLSRYYYSAEIMMEVNIGVNVEYFKRRGIFHLLAGQPAEVLDKHIKSRSQNSIVGYIKSPELVPFLEQSTKEWLQKERGLGSDGKMVTNMQMINSKPLLEELIAYNREDNFDRINALFAIMLAYKQDNLDLEESVYNEENKFLKSINDRIKVLKKGTNRATYSQT